MGDVDMRPRCTKCNSSQVHTRAKKVEVFEMVCHRCGFIEGLEEDELDG